MTAVRLPDVLARRGVLAPAEVVTLVVGLALDVAELHAAGRSHGGVCPEAVAFRPDGRPRLRGPDTSGGAAIVAPEVARGAPAGPAADVFAVAAIGYLALSGRSVWDTDDSERACVRAAGGVRAPLDGPPRLVEALEAALATEPADRCDAQQLAERVLAAGPAAPLRLPLTRPLRPSPPPPPPPPPPRRDHRGITAIEPRRFAPSKAVVPLGVVVISLVALLPLHAAHEPVRWGAVVAGLDRARVVAFADRDVSELSAVYARGSPQLARDTALIRDLAAHGHTVRGRLARLSAPRMLSRAAGSVVLTAVELPAAYVLVDGHGRVVLRVGGGQPRNVVVHLRRVGHSWRLTRIE
ncbi:MAG: eukaryotic-like serine/threonine-protein kinase [Frankiaceae bacterium]|nr:eukaryotic-like serine/threonine-protein kinase [Frankiaceae bacterium]